MYVKMCIVMKSDRVLNYRNFMANGICWYILIYSKAHLSAY